jgi:crotonobetainyl-CoA:carnitine CoA-transferase CaiB-like acyl-CoA transferase
VSGILMHNIIFFCTILYSYLQSCCLVCEYYTHKYIMNSFTSLTKTHKNETALDGQITAYFSSANCGKKSIALDIKEKSGLEIVHKLVKDADVVIASYKPGDAEKLKVDSKTLLDLNPRLIYAEITGYGKQDPRAGYDAVIQAEAGFQFMNGEPDSKPTKMPVALMDVLAAHQLKEAILINLWRREQTGEGAAVNVSLFQAGIASLVNQASSWLRNNLIPQRIGSDHPSIFPYGSVFNVGTLQEPMVFAIGSDKQFSELCKVLDTQWYQDEKFATNKERVHNREELRNLIQEQLNAYTGTRSDLLNTLELKKVPAASVNAMDNVFEIDIANELVVNQENQYKGLRQIAFKGCPEGLDQQNDLLEPPQFGQHTNEILNELGYSNNEIDSMKKANIIK